MFVTIFESDTWRIYVIFWVTSGDHSRFLILQAEGIFSSNHYVENGGCRDRRLHSSFSPHLTVFQQDIVQPHLAWKAEIFGRYTFFFLPLRPQDMSSTEHMPYIANNRWVCYCPPAIAISHMNSDISIRKLIHETLFSFDATMFRRFLFKIRRSFIIHYV